MRYGSVNNNHQAVSHLFKRLKWIGPKIIVRFYEKAPMLADITRTQKSLKEPLPRGYLSPLSPFLLKNLQVFTKSVNSDLSLLAFQEPNKQETAIRCFGWKVQNCILTRLFGTLRIPRHSIPDVLTPLSHTNSEWM